MAAVRQTHHRHLVHLLGFCVENSKKLLVYEYMNKGSLSDLIFNVERRPLWKERVRIALEVAKGIHYLHEECEVPIIHCDIKPQSILMDDCWTAKISELQFWLGKRLMPNQNGIVGVVRESATGNYMASEWRKNGLITMRSNVYSFGIMLFEIICCRSNVEVNVSTSDEILLSTLVYNLFIAQELNKLVAEEEGQLDMKALERMVKVGFKMTLISGLL
ncbi:hypothetical protein Patl1_27830 [Pistacia atlantica]|uniref:Uncharacterized protein n=1 Tax=Pistacia atlantica TaxID=434234 RepID=A0ACC1BDS2_9ROSI|nr:hypothetical protein Patl1_27830 [Pistacia atlantica]